MRTLSKKWLKASPVRSLSFETHRACAQSQWWFEIDVENSRETESRVSVFYPLNMVRSLIDSERSGEIKRRVYLPDVDEFRSSSGPLSGELGVEGITLAIRVYYLLLNGTRRDAGL